MRFKKLHWPLMVNNVSKEDREVLINFLRQDKRLTHGEEVLAFEEEWSKWLGVKYSVFVNSGASANLLTMACLKIAYPEGGNIVVPTLTWVSDISSVIQNGFTPIFVDIDPRTLGMNWNDVEQHCQSYKPIAVFPTHLLGFRGLPEVGAEINIREAILIEDCCEAHGATYPDGTKCGSGCGISNFSFYFAHHMTTIEGGMICTNSKETYETLRMLRSHGLERERTDYEGDGGFKFIYPAYNLRPTELGAVLGRHQLKSLDENIKIRRENLAIFLGSLGPAFRSDLIQDGNSNYAFPLILKNKDDKLVKKVERLLTLCGVEFRKGLSGGGNQLRQTYLKKLGYSFQPWLYPEVEHITDYSWYFGNYPTLEKWKIEKLCDLLNALTKQKN